MFDFSLPTLLAKAVILLVALPVHEFAHAWVAYRLGDDTAARQGRLTLNPLAHLDPIGSLMILFASIGWAKPVPVAPWRLRHGPRVGHALVAAAGPLSNLFLALFAVLPWRLGLLGDAPAQVISFLAVFAAINVALFVFNLIPLAPLDGISVLSGVVGQRMAARLRPLYEYGPFILLGLFMLGYVAPQLNILGGLVSAGMNLVIGLLFGI